MLIAFRPGRELRNDPVHRCSGIFSDSKLPSGEILPKAHRADQEVEKGPDPTDLPPHSLGHLQGSYSGA